MNDPGKMTLRAHLLLALAATSLLIALAIGITGSALLREAVAERYHERLEAESALLAEEASRIADIREARTLARAWSKHLGLRVTLIDSTGVVIADSSIEEAALGQMDNHANRPEVVQARNEEIGKSKRLSASTREQFFYLARKITAGKIVAFVRMALPVDVVKKTQAHYVSWLMAACLAALLLVATVTLVMTARWTRPIEKLTHDALQVAAGGLEHEISAEGTREVLRLSAALREMQSSLRDRIGQIHRERSLLSSTLHSMSEGLVVADDGGRILLASEAVSRAGLVKRSALGLPLNEAVIHPELRSLMSAHLQSGKFVEERIADHSATGRSFLVKLTPFDLDGRDSPNSGTVALILDMTSVESLERMRSQFIADLTHELRTPLTSIIASSETLIDQRDGNEQTTRRFLELMHRQASRMAALVSDLADLSSIESGAVKLTLEPVDVGDLLEDLRKQLQPQVHAKALRFDLRIDDAVVVRADPYRLEQICMNLAENAIKFNRDGGSLTISARMIGSEAEIIFEDTGIGIPEASLEKIFQRLYQVDPARSGAESGTGLGLSIVKHLVRLLGGAISVDSDLGKGTRFVVRLPGGTSPTQESPSS